MKTWEDPAYYCWATMKQRCKNPRASKYGFYGARGVTYCDRWEKFANFIADMGPRPPGTTLDRIDSNGNYEPGNCRWANHEEQHNNTRRNVFVEFGGKNLTLSQWSRLTGVPKPTLARRAKDGWPPERMFEPPLRTNGTTANKRIRP
jgi:hypothetical protein